MCIVHIRFNIFHPVFNINEIQNKDIFFNEENFWIRHRFIHFRFHGNNLLSLYQKLSVINDLAALFSVVKFTRQEVLRNILIY